MRLFCSSNSALPHDIRELTSIRFLAAIWVVVMHFTFELQGDVGILAPLIGRGDLGVDLFFILSGFILTHVYFSQFAERRFSYLRYILFRFGRIYPLHLFTLLLTILIALAAVQLSVIDSSELHWGELPYHLLMIHAWGVTDQTAWNDPSWSISAEWFAYLSTPVVLLIALRLRARPLVFVALAVLVFLAAYALSVALAGKPLTTLITDFAIARIMPEFLLGCALCRLSNAVTFTRSAAVFTSLVGAGAGLAALYLALSDAVIVLDQAALIFALSQLSKHPASTPMRARALVYLGEISFAIYMAHALVDRVVFTLLAKGLNEPEGLPFLPWLAAFPVLIAAAAISHRCIEQPGRTLVRYWTDRCIKTGRFEPHIVAVVSTQSGHRNRKIEKQ